MLFCTYMYRINRSKPEKVNSLLKQERKLFHTQDLALIWGINNKNNLYTTVKRYIKNGVLIPIHKGFYSVIELNKINPVDLGIAYLHQYAYLSTESVLVEYGIISQDIPYFTLVSGVSKKFGLEKNSYFVRQIRNRLFLRSFAMSRANAEIIFQSGNDGFRVSI